jgi:hypothetical protein
MQLVGRTPASSVVHQLQNFPDHGLALEAIRKGHPARAMEDFRRVVDVCSSVLGVGSDMHIAALRQ